MAKSDASKRYAALHKLETRLEPVMVTLAFVWLALLVWEFAAGLTPWMETLGLVLWAVFVADFGMRLLIAPRKGQFLAKNLLVLVSLAIPALRIFRIFRALRVLQLARTARGLQVVRVVGTFNRGMRAVRRALGRRGFGYAAILTIMVVLLGAAAMYSLEPGFASYWDALWWTAMLSTTSGSAFWPSTPEGRVLTYLIALYAFSVFGYVAATLASAFVDQDRHDDDAIEALRREVAEMRKELRGVLSPSQRASLE